MDKWRCSLVLTGAVTLGLPGLARAELVDIVWKSLVGSVVVVELEDGAQVTGKLAGFDESRRSSSGATAWSCSSTGPTSSP